MGTKARFIMGIKSDLFSSDSLQFLAAELELCARTLSALR